MSVSHSSVIDIPATSGRYLKVVISACEFWHIGAISGRQTKRYATLSRGCRQENDIGPISHATGVRGTLMSKLQVHFPKIATKLPHVTIYKIHVYWMKMIKNILFKVLPIASYTFFSPVWHFVDATPKKLLLFWGKPVIEPFLYIFVRSEALLSKCVSLRCK